MSKMLAIFLPIFLVVVLGFICVATFIGKKSTAESETDYFEATYVYDDAELEDGEDLHPNISTKDYMPDENESAH